MTANPETASATEPTFSIVREFNAPRERVFQAWTEPEHISQWFGPQGFIVPRCELDVRPGGTWEIDMQGPDGNVYPNKGVYLEITPPERIVFSDVVDDSAAWGDNPPPSSTVTITFDDLGGKTRMTMLTRFASFEQRDATLEMGAEAGWIETLEKLESFLAA